MDCEFTVSVYFDKEWGDKQQVKREMARRKEMRQRIARQFKQYKPKIEDYDVVFPRAPESLGREIAAFLKGKVGEAEIHGRELLTESDWRRAKFLTFSVTGDHADAYFDRNDDEIEMNRWPVLCKTCGR